MVLCKCKKCKVRCIYCQYRNYHRNIFDKLFYLKKRKILIVFLSIVYNFLWKYADRIRMYLVDSSAMGSRLYPFHS